MTHAVIYKSHVNGEVLDLKHTDIRAMPMKAAILYVRLFHCL